jgi:hypothetical protein
MLEGLASMARLNEIISSEPLLTLTWALKEAVEGEIFVWLKVPDTSSPGFIFMSTGRIQRA